jgi:Double zinc ribbon
MLNETMPIAVSLRTTGSRAPDAPDRALNLSCGSCGGLVSLSFWQPQARCPHCGVLGAPDRALRNLLPLGWECPDCGADNEGRSNFCMACGSGLASRCLRCEAPVYGAVCLQCGQHQAQSLRLQIEQAHRVDWLPIQRERIQKQIAYLRPLADQPEPLPEPIVSPVTPPVNPRTSRRTTRRTGRNNPLRRLGWGWMPLAWGAFMLMQRFRAGLDLSPVQSAGTSLTTGWAWVQGWWAAFIPSLVRIPALTPDNPEYAYLFAVVLIGLVALPFGLYLIDRVVKRLLP